MAPETATALSPAEYAPFPDACPGGSLLEGVLDAIQVVPVSATGFRCTPAWLVPERRVADSMWYWIESGRGGGYVGSEGQPFAFGPGDLILLPRGVAQSTWSTHGSSPRLYTVHFYADAFGGLDALALFGLAGCISPDGEVPAERVTCQLARLYARRPSGWEEEMRHLLWEMLLALIRHHALPDVTTTTGRWRALVRLQPVLEEIDRGLHCPDLSVGALAEVVHVSEVSLRQMFSAGIGKSPIQVIRQRRIERACLLLRTSRRGIKEVACLCGFRNVAFFHKTFRHDTGFTPNAYRVHSEFEIPKRT